MAAGECRALPVQHMLSPPAAAGLLQSSAATAGLHPLPTDPPCPRRAATACRHHRCPPPQGLGLERYTRLFADQEIDLSCVHTVSEEELASIGVADRLHQAGLGRAGACVRSDACSSWASRLAFALLHW